MCVLTRHADRCGGRSASRYRVPTWPVLPATESGRSQKNGRFVGDDDLVEKIQKESWFDFDVVIATPDMMSVVGRLGRLLGPKGLMPNPKSGTVTMDVGQAVTDSKGGKVEYRLDKQNIIHCPIGKVSFPVEKLLDNYNTLMGAIIRAKPAAAKGQYVRRCTLAATMGPGVRTTGRID